MNKAEFTLQELYDFVWEKPLNRFIELYGGTYVEVKELLVRHKIPFPPNGYWSRLREGRKIEKPDFPLGEASDARVIYEPKLKVIRKKRLEAPQNAPIKKVNDYVDRYVAEAKKIYEIESKGRKDNQLISIGYQSLSINVSPLMIERALMLFNLIISEIKKAGGTMNVEPHSTLVIFNGEKFILSMREKQSRIKKPEQKYSWTEYDYVASGVLFFKIGENSWNSKEWSDTAYTIIEDKIEDIISYIKLGALKIKEDRRFEAIRRIEQEKERQIKADVEKRQATELINFTKLKNESELWEKSRVLRNYIDELERHSSENDKLDEEMQRYIEWARLKADWYDPFIKREDELMKDVDRATLAAKKSYW